jgi:hypothetical protein
MIRTRLAALCLSLATAATLAPVAVSASGAEQPAARDGARDAEAHHARRAAMRDQLKAADTDGNRSISRSEAEAGLPRLAENFAQVDDDRNGEVSAEELRKHLGRHDRKEFQAHAAERFAAADTDRNGALDLAEVQTGAPRLADRFTALDANNDGLLSREELQRSFERK